ncbi:MAG: ABC transporter substrate-binding protein [Microlunatus sp.]|nr:ABC transporter substrate-binding protein [Microlunatus sp.]MDN5804839.1 ABC transporter substrate-binding protein [Microlunatus sp.]
MILGASAAAFALAACGGGGGSDPLSDSSASPAAGGGGKVVVGSADFTESQILAQLYAKAMAAKGVEVETRLSIGSREVYIKALQDNSISVIPEYTGNLLLYFDSDAPATTEDEIMKALPDAIGPDLTILEPSKAQDQDVYVVTKETSEKNGITSLADLKKISSTSVLGGPSELEDRAYGPPGLEKIYGAKFKQFKPYDSPAVKVKDLNDNKIQVATFFTTEAAIPDNDYVMLDDPESMILPQNIVPLARADMASNTTAVDAINAVQQTLTTEELTALNKRVEADNDDPRQVAGDWLKSKGLA